MLYKTADELISLSGTRIGRGADLDSSHGVRVPVADETTAAHNRLAWELASLTNPAQAGAVVQTVDAETVDVLPVDAVNSAGALVQYAGSTGNTPTDDATNYYYLDAAGSLQVSTSGFPAGGWYLPLAEVVLADGAITAIIDRRERGLFHGVLAAGGSAATDAPESVADRLDFTAAEPAGPSVGDRYWSTTAGASSETGQTMTANRLAEYNGTDWTEIALDEGDRLWVEDEDKMYAWDGSALASDIAWATLRTTTLYLDGTAVTATAAQLNEAGTFFANTDISGAEAETLSDGTNADSLHVHTLDSGISDVTATAAQLNEAGTFFAATDISGAEAETLTDGSNADSLHDHALSALSGSLADTQLASKIVKRPARKAWGFVQLSAQLNDGDTITIDGRIYEADPSADGITGDVEIDTSGNSTIGEDVTDIAYAINTDGSAVVDAVADTTHDIVWLYAKTAGSSGNVLLGESTSEARMKVSNNSLKDGEVAHVVSVQTIQHTLTANEAAAGVLRIDTGLYTYLQFVQVQIHDGGNGGTLKTPDVAVSNPGIGILTITEGSAPAWANGDIFYILVIGIE